MGSLPAVSTLIIRLQDVAKLRHSHVTSVYQTGIGVSMQQKNWLVRKGGNSFTLSIHESANLKTLRHPSCCRHCATRVDYCLSRGTGPKWPVGLMDKASASGAGDSRFESWAGHSFWWSSCVCKSDPRNRASYRAFSFTESIRKQRLGNPGFGDTGF